MTYLILVVLHISLASMWFGAPLMLGSVLKKSAAAGPSAFAAGTGVAKPPSALAASVPAAPRSMPQPRAEKAYDAETERLRQRIAELEQARPAGADIV